MNLLPRIKQLKTIKGIQHFATHFSNHSGHSIPSHYLYKARNRFFTIYWKEKLIGGFILGYPPKFRVIDLFIDEAIQPNIYKDLGVEDNYTEISCFWINSNCQHKLFLLSSIWIAISSILNSYGTPNFLFGTTSQNIAGLFSNQFQAKLIHQQFFHRRSTFVFLGNRKNIIKGVFNNLICQLKTALRFKPNFLTEFA